MLPQRRLSDGQTVWVVRCSVVLVTRTSCDIALPNTVQGVYRTCNNCCMAEHAELLAWVWLLFTTGHTMPIPVSSVSSGHLCRTQTNLHKQHQFKLTKNLLSDRVKLPKNKTGQSNGQKQCWSIKVEHRKKVVVSQMNIKFEFAVSVDDSHTNLSLHRHT